MNIKDRRHLQHIALVFTKDHKIRVVKVAPTSSFIGMCFTRIFYLVINTDVSHANSCLSMQAYIHICIFRPYKRKTDRTMNCQTNNVEFLWSFLLTVCARLTRKIRTLDTSLV